MSAVVASGVADPTTRAVYGEHNPLVNHPKRDPAKDRCCHMSPRVGCALGAAKEVQSRRGGIFYLVSRRETSTPS